MQSGFIIMVAGVPGTGKTTISKLLAGEIECSVLETTDLALKLRVAKDDPTGRLTLTLDHEGMEALSDALRARVSRGCIVVSTVYPESLLPMLDDLTVFVLLLRLHPFVLEKRLEMRRWPRSKILENLIAEATNYYHDALYDYRESIIEIDTTRKTPESVSGEAIEMVTLWKTGFHVDWLSDPRVVEALSKWLGELDANEDWTAYRGRVY